MNRDQKILLIKYYQTMGGLDTKYANKIRQFFDFLYLMNYGIRFVSNVFAPTRTSETYHKFTHKIKKVGADNSKY